jgi:hypothetical protein
MLGSLSNIASGWYQQVSNTDLLNQQMGIAKIQAQTGQSTTALFGGMFGSGSSGTGFSSPLVWLLILIGAAVMVFRK